ncbi:cobalt-precorrin-6A reductase [Acidisphaera rubrifaciens]|uniref:cobalt-precorrin-6A reductase n=1 Tax=Acidisphaera rubrifaciens TaxID=50715 RepID=UPI0006620784
MRVLILGGTTEASLLCRALAGDGRFAPTLSLAGRTNVPALPPIDCRIGGYGGARGLAAYLRERGVHALIDAVHPYAARMSHNAVAAAASAGVPLLALRRPAWTPVEGDKWTIVADLAAASRALGALPRRVFLTVGRQELGPFRDAPWHRYVVRSVDLPASTDLPPDSVAIAARGPFDVAAEGALLAAHAIDVIVTKNAGGEAVRAKLDAARALGIAVIMTERPVKPPAETVATADAARRWLIARHCALRGA